YCVWLPLAGESFSIATLEPVMKRYQIRTMNSQAHFIPRLRGVRALSLSRNLATARLPLKSRHIRLRIWQGRRDAAATLAGSLSHWGKGWARGSWERLSRLSYDSCGIQRIPRVLLCF